MTEERSCTQGHVIDTGKDVCQRCGASPVAPVVAEEAVAEESVDNEVVNEEKEVDNQENATKNGLVEPEKASDVSDVNPDLQENQPAQLAGSESNAPVE